VWSTDPFCGDEGKSEHVSQKASPIHVHFALQFMGTDISLLRGECLRISPAKCKRLGESGVLV